MSTIQPAGGENNVDQCDDQPGQKRRRIALACTACRTRKSRCDGTRPICKLCRRMGFDCSYEMPQSATNLIINKDIFASLENRVKLLENVVSEHTKHLSDTRNAQTICNTPSESVESLADNNQQAIHSSSPAPLRILINVPADQEQPLEDATDGMAITLTDDQESIYFGPSSNIAFTRHIDDLLKKHHTCREDVATSSSHKTIFGATTSRRRRPFPFFSNDARSANDAPANVLPSQIETELLLDHYFNNTGLLFPYIDKIEFLETYNQLKARGYSSQVRRSWLVLLNVVMAMARCTATAPDLDTSICVTPATVFYQRAKELSEVSDTHGPQGIHLENVQYLLLMSQYLQGAHEPLNTWMAHGLAVKSALAIGLHSRETLARLSLTEQEIRKRTWQGCVLQDRSLCMTFGRPSSIPDEYCQLNLPNPLPVADLHENASIDFYNATILLYKILWKILAKLYDNNMGCQNIDYNHGLAGTVFQLSQELEDWQKSLPSAMSVWSAAKLASNREHTQNETQAREDDPVLVRFHLILTLRYLYVQILLYRPVLIFVLKDKVEGNATASHGYRIVTVFAQNCLTAAEDIIRLSHNILTCPTMGTRVLGAWWYTYYYVFNAALVVFSSILLHPDNSSPSAAETQDAQPFSKEKQSIQDAIDALLCLCEDNPVLERCIKHLRYLLTLVDEYTLPVEAPASLASVSAPVMVDAAGDNAPMDAASGTHNGLVSSQDLALRAEMGSLNESPLSAVDFQSWLESLTSM
ncbi:hypothetical protein LMH87_009561 [Akanthomyces muscarius]|uniref:Zn(2)-C6 fungal-type domain-containing protein n=1 Tax=Akanthomyces muscarius TaxID=2231603 RepID=A0A9W8QDR7_AKAMU|nr:hypothetical protein LMH87_009561 [Akanthomyces muscarius]KAJ4153053.1 hypothetical protein LMH87_009561 [Akanthomyces muscarius]